jgi:hypothetical protein
VDEAMRGRWYVLAAAIVSEADADFWLALEEILIKIQIELR